MKQNPKICSKCPYYQYDTFVPFELNGSDVLFIAEAPGKDEVLGKPRRPLIGRSGQLLRKELLDKYLGEGNYDLANIVCCRPPNNETPKAKVRNLCAPQFIDKVVKNYKYVVLLGEVAFHHFFPKDETGKKTKYSTYVNNFVEIDNQIFYTMYHPAYVVRNTSARLPKYKEMFLRWYKRHKDRYAERNYTWVKTNKEFDEEFSGIGSVCAIDVETEGLYGALKSVAIAYTNGQAFAWLVKHPDNYDMSFKAYTRSKLQELLLNKNVKKVFHNAKYDIKVLYDNGYQVAESSIDDTMILAYLYNDTEPSYGLKELSAKYLDGYNDIAPLTDDAEKLIQYNCEDVDNTLRLYHKYINTDVSINLYSKIVMPALFLLLEMEMRGALVDKEYLKGLQQLFSEQTATAEQKLHELYPKETKGLLMSSPAQVADLLYNKLKYPATVKTKKGAPSTNKEALASLVVEQNSEAAKLILDYRKAAILKDTFIENSLLGKIQEDGRIHTKFNQTVTSTGRLSSSGPNLQNMPRREDVRDAFIAPEGYYIMDNDLSQIELRIIASLANERHMIAAYKAGVDLHTYTAAHVILNTGVENVTKDVRSKAKPVNFGFIYGMRAKKFLTYALISYGVIFALDEAIKIRRAFFKRYSDLPRYYKEIERLVKFHRFVESPFGRKRRFPPYMYRMATEYEISEVFRKAVNSPTQGTASDIMMMIAVGVRKIVKKLNLPIYPFLTVHDSVMYYVKKNYVEDAYNIVQDVTKDVEAHLSWLKVPLVIESSIGKRWGHTKSLE